MYSIYNSTRNATTNHSTMYSIYNSTRNATTNYTTEPCTDDQLSYEPRASFIFRAVSTALIILFSLVGNILVCSGAIRRRNRPFSYYLIINLALAELVITAIQPFNFHYQTKPFTWVFGEVMCHLVNPLKQCVALVVTFTLAAIAIYRCMMLAQPYRYRPTVRVAYRVMACSWFWGIVLSIPDSYTRKLRKQEFCGKPFMLCDSAFQIPDYRVVIFILNFVAPFIVMVVAYGIVVFRVKKHITKTREKALEMSDSFGTRSSIMTSYEGKKQPADKEAENNGQVGNGSPDPIMQASCALPTLTKKKGRQESRMMQLEADVLNMIYINIIVFFLCYLPSNLLFISKMVFDFKPINEAKSFWLMHWYVTLLHFLPSALHPICYGATSKVLGMSFRPLCR